MNNKDPWSALHKELEEEINDILSGDLHKTIDIKSEIFRIINEELPNVNVGTVYDETLAAFIWSDRARKDSVSNKKLSLRLASLLQIVSRGFCG